MSWSLRNTALFTGGLPGLERRFGVPSEWDGLKTLDRDFGMPVGFLRGLERRCSMPVENAAAQGRVKIVSAEYTGTGTASRSFAVPDFTPVLVIVLGQDGSTNFVGAMKTQAMPSGKSQPFANDVAVGGASRSNRILDIFANGFSVGSDLNVSGRPYAYLAFPDAAPSILVGTYVGSGGDITRNTALATNKAAGTITGIGGIPFCIAQDCDTTKWRHPAADTPYTPSAALVTGGRRIIRNSDGAVIAELTQFNSTSSANGNVYIEAGFIAGNSWHLEEQYVDLGGPGDVLILMADASVGAPIPAPMAPGILADFFGDSNQNLDTTGLSPGDGFLPANDPRLHVIDFYNAFGVTFHWFVLRAALNLSGLEMGKFDYTGSGALGTPPNLQGLPFAPFFAFAVDSGNNFTRWAKRDSAVVASGNTYAFWDGQGQTGFDAPTFQSDGISIPASSTWNTNGLLYRMLQFAFYPPIINRDVGAPVEWFQVLARDVGARIEWLLNLARHAGVPAEWVLDQFRNAGIPTEWGGFATRNYDLPVEWPGFAVRDWQIPAEWIAQVSRAAGIPVEWTATMLRDFGVPAEWVGVLARDYRTPAEWIAALQRDTGVPLEWLVALMREAGLPMEWGGIVSADFPAPVEWLGQLSRRYGTPAEWLASLTRDHGIPLEFTQAVARAFGLPAEWRGQLSRVFRLPVDWGQDFALLRRTAGMPTEWSGLAQAVLRVTWNVLVRLRASLPTRWNVLSGGLVAALQVTWICLERLSQLGVVWRVVPDTLTPFSEDVQRPVGDVEETP